MKMLTEQLRAELKSPFGKVMKSNELASFLSAKPRMLIAVGDTCAVSLIKNKIKPDIIVYDLLNMRQPVDEETAQILLSYKIGGEIVVKNPAGSITSELVSAVSSSLASGKGKIRIEGEEDLAALLFFRDAPLGAVVVYGQPNEGAVVTLLDEKLKEKATRMLSEMEENGN
ncbi:MAG: DUF359 domain-containing protein [Candidatus Micrarchaeota archaeon]